jgi:hypothetical protein
MVYAARVYGETYPPYMLRKTEVLDLPKGTPDRDAIANRYINGVYGSGLLSFWVPGPEGYVLYPRYGVPGLHRPIPFAVLVLKEDPFPVLLLDYRLPSEFDAASGRKSVIDDIMEHIDTVSGETTRDFYMISVVGTKWRAWVCPNGSKSDDVQVVPGIAQETPAKSTDPSGWNPNIFSVESFAAFQKIAQAIDTITLSAIRGA